MNTKLFVLQFRSYYSKTVHVCNHTTEIVNTKNLNIFKTEQGIDKLKTPLKLVWKCFSDAHKIRSTIFRRRSGTLTEPMSFEMIIRLGKRHISILSTRNVMWTLGGGGLAPVTFLREKSWKISIV